MAKKNDKRKNNDIQNMTPKTKDRVTRTPLKLCKNSGALEGSSHMNFYTDCGHVASLIGKLLFPISNLRKHRMKSYTAQQMLF